MATIREQAKAYEPKQTKNIAELEKVPVDVTMAEAEYQKDDGTTFKVNEIEINGEVYRVPNSVIKQLKVLLEDKPDSEFFKVKKTGEGLQTEYTVILE